MELTIFTDGGSKGNPGPASIGVAFYKDGKIFDTYRKDIGVGTNNEAEYKAVIAALSIVRDNRNKFGNPDIIKLFSDSNLMVNQLNGVYKVKKGHIREFVMAIRILESEINIPIVYKYIPREENAVADSLVNNTYFSSSSK